MDVVGVAVEAIDAQPEAIKDGDSGDVELLPHLFR